MTTSGPPFSPNDFKALIIQEDDTLCTAIRNLTKLSVMWWKMVRFKYKPDGTGFTADYLEMIQAALADCPDVDVDLEGETPNPQDFKNFLVSPSSIFCEKFVKFAIGLSNKLYELVAFEYDSVGEDFSDDFKALLCGVDCGEPPEDIDIMTLLNYRNFLRWDVVSGEVDLIGMAPWDPVTSAVGMYVDLAGTDYRPKVNETVWNGGIRTKAAYAFPIVAGKSYRITYKLAGHHMTSRSGSPLANRGICRVRVLRSDGSQYESVDASHTPSAYNMAMTEQTVNFTAGSDEPAALLQLENTQSGTVDNVGPKIDDIRVTNMTDGIVLLDEDFEDEFLGRGEDSEVDVTLPDPDDSKDAIPLLSMEVCEKMSKIVIDFPRNVYDVVSWEYNAAGNGFGKEMKFMICNPVATIDPETPEEEENGLLVGLQAYWKHNEVNGDVLDAHAGHSLTEDGGLLTSDSPGKLDTARGYPGTAVAQVASDTWNTVQGGDFSFSAWVKFTDPTVGGLQAILCKGEISECLQVLWAGGATQKFQAHVSGVDIELAASLVAGEWYFVCLRGRVDGGSLSLNLCYGAGGTLTHATEVSEVETQNDSGGMFRLGGGEVASVLSSMLTGSLDEVALWTRELSDANVEELYGSGTPPSYDDFTV